MRLHKTLIDYLVIAISPALIIALVGSLVFFLIQVAYQGSYQGRLQYILGLFVIGAVLIGRISIEDGRERAVLFAVPLGIVTLLAINKFVAFQGTLAPMSFWVNCGLIAIVWWSADKLTWDCTLIDESEEDSGEGLLETVGLDRPRKTAVKPEISPALEHDKRPPLAVRLDHVGAGVSSRPTESKARRAEAGKRPQGWWGRFVERRRRPHAPGVWVVYFSLAALPLFGLGQLFIPADNLPDRQYAFQLLCVYTASGLGLLLTTSFLGLRRYLRQRRQEMPLAMVNLWLGIGLVLIVVVMAATMLLPRPNPEYAIAEFPLRVGSPDQKPSRYGMGRDGVEQKESWARGEQHRGEPDDAAPSDQSTTETKASPKGEQPTDGEKPTAARQSSSQDARSEQDRDGRSSQSAPPQAVQPTHSPVEAPLALMAVFKWLLYMTLAAVAVVALWKNRHALLTSLRDSLYGILEFLRNLFSGSVYSADAAADAPSHQSLQRHFADFTDPFAAGTAGQYRPEELVRYTFEAVEAWARDHGHPRDPEQTPHEFARRLASHFSSLTDDGLRLAELYAQAAYAPGTVSAASAAPLSRLWQTLRTEPSPKPPLPLGEG